MTTVESEGSVDNDGGLSETQRRTVAVALELFARHGVSGTSLQMIADELGVTKAAVYFQFRTKDEIVLAAAQSELARLLAVITAAEAERSRRRARDTLVAGMVDLAVESRRTASAILRDPAVIGSFDGDPMFRNAMHRLRRLLFDDDDRPQARVRAAMLVALMSGAVMHPFVADLDDEALRVELLRVARRFLGSLG